jgi:Tol biopolymer transport system component
VTSRFHLSAAGTGIFSKGKVSGAWRHPFWPRQTTNGPKTGPGYLAYGVNSGTAAFGNLFVLPLFGDRKPILVSESPFAEDEPQFSFDGKWLAYNSNESGTAQVYVVAFPVIGQKRQVSTAGGVQPRWRRDDRELYYLAPDGAMMAVEFRASPTSESVAPRALFNTGLNADPFRDQYAVSPDGKRFLIQLPAQEGNAMPVTVVMNWAAALRK